MRIIKIDAFFKALDGKGLDDTEIADAINTANLSGLNETISPSIISKVQQFGRFYPNYLTQEEIEEADKSYITVAYLDLLAKQRDAYIRRQYS